MIADKFEHAARYCCLAMVACLSFTTAGANLALVAFIICALISKKWVTDFHLIWKHPVAQLSIACFFVLCLSQLWSGVEAELSWAWISKYKKLFLIPMVIPFFQRREYKVALFHTLFISLLLGLVVSYTNYFGLTEVGDCPAVGCTAHSYITLSMLNCLLFIMAIAFFKQEKVFIKKALIASVAFFAWLNIVSILPSRTGQILIFVLIVWFPFVIWNGNFVSRRMKWVSFISAVMFVGLSLGAIYATKGSRLVESIEKISSHKAEAFNSKSASVSVDVRFEFYKKSLVLIGEKPLLGWGAGAHEPKLLSMSSEGEVVFSNPHNEYLLWLLQTGVLGLFIFLCWLCVVWRYSRRVVNFDEKVILQGWLLIFILGSFLNSFLLDFSEGYMTAFLIAALTPFRINEELP
ncbi:MAG: hypothetical protein RLZ36_247 [Pseudomonadota bacterium]|jgi:O-antigen ligase